MHNIKFFADNLFKLNTCCVKSRAKTYKILKIVTLNKFRHFRLKNIMIFLCDKINKYMITMSSSYIYDIYGFYMEPIEIFNKIISRPVIEFVRESKGLSRYWGEDIIFFHGVSIRF